MKKLIMMRHAKSDWNQPAGDFHRPLLSQGIQDAKLVGAEMAKFFSDHFVIWSSAAERAMQTAFIVADQVSYPQENIILKQDLYTFDVKALEKTIKTCDNLYDCLVVFGHNEAITDFVNKFGDIFIDNVPTAGCVTLTFGSNDWNAIGIGTTGNVIFPRNLRP
jgi:phosphohistidine phosphatase